MGRCILVIGPHRSGTSCTAGVLHHLGARVLAGPQASRGNPAGHWEDPEFVGRNNRAIGGDYRNPACDHIPDDLMQEYRETVRLREGHDGPVITIKDPRFCFTARFVAPLFTDCRVVAVMRRPDASANSLKTRETMTWSKARRITAEYRHAMEAFLGEWDGPATRVRYDDLVDKREKAVDRLAGFAFAGMEQPTETQRGEAMRFVREGLRHHQ